MDQIKIGSFLKELRKEKNLTQENLAEKLNVSNRTISRWETGSNMPDIGMLVEIAEFYDVSIPEIINGERKSENMNQETKETGKQRIIGALLSGFGIFVIVSALSIFPSESSWGSIYSVIGSILLITGIYFLTRRILARRVQRIICIAACAVILFGIFSVTDYVAVKHFNQVPRFSYETGWDSRNPDQLVYKTLFFTAVRKNPGTENEVVEILK